MKFSIIICTYNAAKRLPKTLDSIFAQTYDDYEVVIVDGASTDGTQNVILEYGKKFSDKLRWISERDTGLYNALNKGVKLARGKYLNIVGAGDWLEKDALSGASECIKKNPQADAVYGITKVWDKHCEENRLVQTSPDVLPIQPMQHPSMYYKKNLHDKFGQYDESYEIVADYVFCLKAFYFGRATACSFNTIVDNFVMDGKSSLEKEKCTEEDARAKRELGISERDIESALVTNQKNQNKIITNKEIDVFIISYNRVTYLKTLVSWLEKAGFEKIHIVDNNSTYPPLLEYLKSSKHNVHKMRKNYGHLVVWESGEFDEILNNKYYIVSDCDVVPIDDCPMEITSYFFQILQKYNEVTKVGFSLKIDDLPEHFIFRDSVVDWEKQFWNKRRGEGLFDAPIDTTFALYRPGIYPSDNAWWNSIRTYYPYMAKHTPWYANTYEPSEEDIYYQGEIKNRSSFWSTTDIDALNMYYKDLLLELKGVYASRRWKFLRILYKSRSIFTGKNIPGEYRKIELLISDNKNAKELQEKNKDFAVALGNIYSDPLWKILQNIEDMRTRFSVKKYSNFIMHGKMRQPLRQIYYAIRFKKIK